MRIELTELDTANFLVKPYIFYGEQVFLVIPNHIGCEWTPENRHFRSSVWNLKGELVSASFPKFFNWGEKPAITPPPQTLEDARLVEKIDGSALIISKYKGNFMVRTRRTIDARGMEKNGDEVEILLTKYPAIKELYPDWETWTFSLIFEWVSPRNQIVIRYTEPDLFLVGAVNHGGDMVTVDYELWTQDSLDKLALELGVKRPQIFNFSHVQDMLLAISELQGQEGLCVYFKHGQEILKVKSAWYLVLHRMKSELSNIDGVIDLYFSTEQKDMAPLSHDEFYGYICRTFDYELAEMVRGHVSKMFDAIKESQQIVFHMRHFVEPLKKLSRKDAAQKIIGAYGKTNRSGFAFTLLDGKDLTIEQRKKLIYQTLK